MEDTCYMFCSYEYMEDNNLCYVALNLKSKLRKIDIWNEILCATAAHFAFLLPASGNSGKLLPT
jgi:hypothetical protein